MTLNCLSNFKIREMIPYNFQTPENTILSLERAYTKKDMDGILNARDFHEEAKLILSETIRNNDTIIHETAELLRLSLFKNITDNGFPSFLGASNEFSKIEKRHDNLYEMYEKIVYSDGRMYFNKVILSIKNRKWKVVMINEIPFYKINRKE